MGRRNPFQMDSQQTHTKTIQVRWPRSYSAHDTKSRGRRRRDQLGLFVKAAKEHGWEGNELELVEQDCPDTLTKLLLEYLPNVSTLNLDFKTTDIDYKEVEPDVMHLNDDCGIQKYIQLRSFINSYLNSQTTSSSWTAVKLERLEISNPYPVSEEGYPWPGSVFWDFNQLPGIFFLPNLRHISFVKCYLEGDFVGDVNLRRVKGTSPLEHISIEDAALDASALDALLTTPRALKSLKYHVADVHDLWCNTSVLPQLVPPFLWNTCILTETSTFTA